MSWVAAGVGGAAAIGGGALSFMGANSQSKKIREAMERYLHELRTQRQTFLDQPESQSIRAKLGSYINGDVGYSPDTLNTMKTGVYEDYGKGLSDMTRLTNRAGAASTGVYTPGRADRTARLIGQNLASNRARDMRDIQTRNADVALQNQRLAVSAMPTYLPGMPATQVAGPDVFMKAGETPHFGSFLGPSLAQAGSLAATIGIYGPLMEKMSQSPSNTTGFVPWMNYPGMNPYSNLSEMHRRTFPTS